MTNTLFKITLLLVIWLFNFQSAVGQANVQSVELKKGTVLDILLLSQKSDTEADLKAYFQDAFPVAKRLSYQSFPGFKISRHSEGNLHPSALIFGKWDNLSIREQFLEEITDEVPDFHERRRKIWSYFGLRYFEIKEDLSLEIDRDQYHVASAFWLDTKQTKRDQFYKHWEKKVQKMDGNILLHLKDGKSPFGYRFDPDLFIITTWESEAAFNAFQAKNQKSISTQLQHVNTFILK